MQFAFGIFATLGLLGSIVMFVHVADNADLKTAILYPLTVISVIVLTVLGLGVVK